MPLWQALFPTAERLAEHIDRQFHRNADFVIRFRTGSQVHEAIRHYFPDISPVLIGSMDNNFRSLLIFDWRNRRIAPGDFTPWISTLENIP